jgi:hypothetical protein
MAMLGLNEGAVTAMAKKDSAQGMREQQQAMERELQELSSLVEQLRVKYDRYFMGLDRIPPEKLRANLEREFRNSKLQNTHKTALRFKFETIRQRMTTYKRYWDRILRMIEEGRFKREKSALASMGMRPPAGAPPKPTDGDEGVYRAWKEAQKQLGRSSDVDFDRFKQKLAAQRASQKQKYGWDSVDYSVRVKDGKVALVAKPGDSD